MHAYKSTRTTYVRVAINLSTWLIRENIFGYARVHSQKYKLKHVSRLLHQNYISNNHK